MERKYIRVVAVTFIFLAVLMYVSTGYCNNPSQDAAKEHLKRYTDEERAQFQLQADRIFEGTIADVAVFKGNTCNAFEGDLSNYKTIGEALDSLDLRWLVTFKVDKIIKGKFLKDTYEILVHSPAISFGFGIGVPEKGIKRDDYGAVKYRIYVKLFPLCPSMIAAEILDQ